MSDVVGVVRVGRMGSAIAMNLAKAGFDVVGYDIEPDRQRELEELGGRAVDSAQAVAEAADRVITSLPSAAALDEAVSGPAGLLAAKRPQLVVIETSTRPLEVKERNRAAAEDASGLFGTKGAA